MEAAALKNRGLQPEDIALWMPDVVKLVFSSRMQAYFDFNGLSTEPLEGTNNKTKTLHKMAYGFRDVEFFKLKIMALHETNYVLVG